MPIPALRPPRRWTFWRDFLADDDPLQVRVATVAQAINPDAPGTAPAAVLTMKMLDIVSKRLTANKGSAPSAAWSRVNRLFYEYAAGVFGNTEFNEDADTYVLNTTGARFAAAIRDSAIQLAEDAKFGVRGPGVQAPPSAGPATPVVVIPPPPEETGKGGIVLAGLLLLGLGGLALKRRN